MFSSPGLAGTVSSPQMLFSSLTPHASHTSALRASPPERPSWADTSKIKVFHTLFTPCLFLAFTTTRHYVLCLFLHWISLYLPTKGKLVVVKLLSLVLSALAPAPTKVPGEARARVFDE